MMTLMKMRRISARRGSVGIKWRNGPKRKTGKKSKGKSKRKKWSHERNDDLLDLSALSTQAYYLSNNISIKFHKLINN